MYKLEYLPLALQDILEIVNYISNNLSNPEAAQQLAEDIVAAAEKMKDFPYSNMLFIPPKPLKHEYRKLIVKHFILFYWIEEDKKTVTIARVMYNQRNYEQILE